MTYAPRADKTPYTALVDEQLGAVHIAAERDYFTNDITYVLTTNRRAVSGKAQSMAEVYAAAQVLNND
jgi:hypothetical protein